MWSVTPPTHTWAHTHSLTVERVLSVAQQTMNQDNVIHSLIYRQFVLTLTDAIVVWLMWWDNWRKDRQALHGTSCPLSSEERKIEKKAVYHYHCMLLFSSRFGNTPAHTGSHHLHIQWYPLPSIAHHNQTASSWRKCIWLLTDRGGKDRHRYPSGLPKLKLYMHCT